MTDLFYFIEYLFVEIIFIPLDFLRFLELKNWLLANSVNFFFIIVISSALTYWTIQLLGFSKRGEEDTDQSAHSFVRCSSRLGRNEEYPKKDYTNADSKMKGQGNIGPSLNSICKVKLSGKTLYSLGYCK